MFEDIKFFRCWKLYLLKINKPSRWKRAKMVAISEDCEIGAVSGMKDVRKKYRVGRGWAAPAIWLGAIIPWIIYNFLASFCKFRFTDRFLYGYKK